MPLIRPLAFVFASCVALGTAAAMPVAAPADAPTHDMVVRVGGCHADIRTHFVPEFGRAVAHRHRADCRPVAVGGGSNPVDCHRDAREHHVPGMGRVYHRHVGENCAIRVIRRSSSRNPG